MYMFDNIVTAFGLIIIIKLIIIIIARKTIPFTLSLSKEIIKNITWKYLLKWLSSHF